MNIVRIIILTAWGAVLLLILILGTAFLNGVAL